MKLKISSTIKNKVLILNLIVLCALNSNAQSLLPRFELSYFIDEHNVITRGSAKIYNDGNSTRPQHIDVEMNSKNGNFMFKTGLLFKYKKLEISGDASTFCRKTNFTETSFIPIMAIWDFKASYVINKIKLSFVHQCTHPIKSRFDYNETYGGFEGFSISYGY